MALLRFSQFAPDLTDLDTDVSAKILNVFPRADGYGPVPDIASLTTTPAACRGYFFARNTDGSITVFFGSSTDLWVLDNSSLSWTNVTAGGAGSYTPLLPGDQWTFAQDLTTVVACNIGTAPQKYVLGSSSVFANLGGSPPAASFVTVVNGFLVLSGLIGNPNRVQWSGLGQIEVWDNLNFQSNFQDLPDGGSVYQVAGSDIDGVIFQDSAIRRMVFAPGAPYTFFISRVAQDEGIFAKYSVVRAGDEVYYCSLQGFKKIPPGGYPTFIGKERIDRSFFADVDTANLQLVIGASDPRSTRVFFTYKSLAGQSGSFDKVIVYDRVLDKLSLVNFTGQYIASLAVSSNTLEGLDTIAPGIIAVTGAANNGSGAIRLAVASLQNGLTDLTAENTVEVYGVHGTTEANGNWQFTVIDPNHIDLKNSTFTNAYTSGGSIGGALDALGFSLDAVSVASLAKLSIATTTSIGYLTGDNLEATIETTESDLGGPRMFVGEGFRVFTDATSALGSMFVRNNSFSAATQTIETGMNELGICPQRAEARYMRARVRIPAGIVWTYAMGVEPINPQPAGER